MPFLDKLIKRVKLILENSKRRFVQCGHIVKRDKGTQKTPKPMFWSLQ